MVDENLIISLDKLARRHSCCAIIYCRSYRSSDSMPDFHHDGYERAKRAKIEFYFRDKLWDKLADLYFPPEQKAETR